MRVPCESIASMKNGSPYQAAKVMRRKIDSSAHSSAGDSKVFPHGVVTRKVSLPITPVVRDIDWIHCAYFSSQLRPESWPQAIPAARAAAVSRSSQRLTALHT